MTVLQLQTETQIFAPSAGGGAAAMAAEFGVPFIGRLPIDPALLLACEEVGRYLRHTSLPLPSSRELSRANAAGEVVFGTERQFDGR